MIKTKFSLILTLCFSSILIISIIVLSILQTNTKPNLPNPDSIKIYNKSLSAAKTYEKGSTEYNEILKIYGSMFEKTYLDQISDDKVLSGKISEDTTSAAWNENNKQTGVYVEFVYDTAKNFIIYRDGNSRRVDIKSIFIKPSSINDVEMTHIYYETEKPTTSSSDKDKTTPEPNYPLITEANTYELNTYIKSLLEE